MVKVPKIITKHNDINNIQLAPPLHTHTSSSHHKEPEHHEQLSGTTNRRIGTDRTISKENQDKVVIKLLSNWVMDELCEKPYRI